MSDNIKKPFWKKPEGILNYLLIGGIAATIFYFWGVIVPFVLLTLTNTIYTVIAAVVLFVLLYVLFDKRYRTLAWYLYNMFLQKTISLVVERNPIAIIKAYIEDLTKKRAEIGEQITKFRGELGKIDKLIATNKEDIMRNMKLANAAKTQGQTGQLTLASREAGRLQESNTRLEPVAERMRRTYTYLVKLYENTGFIIEDMRSDARVKETEYNAIKKSHSIMKGAKAIMVGDKDKKGMYDMALEALQDDMGRRVGEVEDFMNLTKNYIDKVDVENGVYVEDGLEMLEKYTNGDFAKLLAPPSSTTSLNFDMGQKPEPITLKKENNNNKYNNLLDV